MTFLVASLLASQASSGLAAAATATTAPASTNHTFRGTCRFSVSARRFLFSSRRRVEASVEVRNLAGSARFDLDRPFHAHHGVHHLVFEVRVEDEHGTVVDRISSTVRDGMQSMSMPLRFPAAGVYQLILDEQSIDAGPARVALRPRDRIVMQVVAGTPSTVASLPALGSRSHATAVSPAVESP